MDCSPHHPGCDTGQSCYITTDGFRCQPDTVIGCIMSSDGLYPMSANLPLQPVGDRCYTCAIPAQRSMRETVTRHVNGIMSDEGWRTYGNCATGYCGFSGVCRALKPDGSLCLTGQQCKSGTCTPSSRRDNQLACTPHDASPLGTLPSYITIVIFVVGGLLLSVGVVWYCGIKCRRAVHKAKADANGTEMPDEKRNVRAILGPLISAGLGLLIILAGWIFYSVGASYSRDDDSNN